MSVVIHRKRNANGSDTARLVSSASLTKIRPERPKKMMNDTTMKDVSIFWILSVSIVTPT